MPNVDLESKVHQQLVEAQAQAAEYEQQLAHGWAIRARATAGCTRAAALLERAVAGVGTCDSDESTTLAARTAQRTALQTELKVAQTSYETVSARLREFRASAGTHAEQLRVIDPGIVPQQPSSPNILLNVAAAFFAGHRCVAGLSELRFCVPQAAGWF